MVVGIAVRSFQSFHVEHHESSSAHQDTPAAFHVDHVFTDLKDSAMAFPRAFGPES
jgi:hypothetical protein